MKKNAVMLLCALMTVSMLSACGATTKSTSGSETETVSESATETKSESETTAESTEESASVSELDGIPVVSSDTPLEECITLGDYIGLEVTKTIETVTDEDVMEALASELYDYVDDENYEVQDGDTVDIAFVGKLNGEAFDGGTSDSYELTIGSGTFIDGFEDGCIGMKLGETRNLDLTFPENYGSEELAGQAVVFEVTINAIIVECEYSEEWVKKNYPDYASGEEFLAARKEELQAANNDDADSALQSEMMVLAMDNATYLGLRESDIERGGELYDSNYSYYASLYGMELEDFVEAYLGKEEYEEARNSYAISVAKASLLMEAIAKEQGWETGDADYEQRLADYSDLYNMSSEELIEYYGEENVNTNILMDRTIDFVYDNAIITEEYVDEE